jgi:hypothetical protein
MTLRGRAFAGALVWVTLASAGCADEGEGDPSSSVGTSATEQGAGDEQSDAERREDEEAAEAALLVLDDFPAGWEAEPAEEDDDAEDADIRAALDDCLGVDESEPDTDNPSASSPTFTSPDDEEVTAEVTLTPSAGDARRTIERLESDAAPGCYADAIGAVIERNLQDSGGMQDDVELGEPTVERIPFERLGDGTVAFRSTLPVSVQGTDLELFFDTVFVRVGSVGIETSFSSEITPFDSGESERLTRIVVDRVAEADLG